VERTQHEAAEGARQEHFKDHKGTRKVLALLLVLVLVLVLALALG